VRVGVEAGVARDPGTDSDHRAPLGEARTEPEIVLEPAAQAVQSLGHLFSGREREVVRALVHLDPGDDALFLEVSRERLVARYRALAEGFVEQDHPLTNSSMLLVVNSKSR